MGPISRSICDFVFGFRAVERPVYGNGARSQVVQGEGNQKTVQRLNFVSAMGSKFFQLFGFTIFGSWLNVGSKSVNENHLIEEFDLDIIMNKKRF